MRRGWAATGKATREGSRRGLTRARCSRSAGALEQWPGGDVKGLWAAVAVCAAALPCLALRRRVNF